MNKRTRRPKVGTMHSRGALFLCIHAGEAAADGSDKPAYHLSVQAVGYHPIVRSEKTGKAFSLTWQDIIALAVAAGIDEK